MPIPPKDPSPAAPATAPARPIARVAVIVVTHNSAPYLPRLYAALAAQSLRGWRLIVFDNASRADQRPDPTQAPPGAVVIQSEQNLGFAEANNRAAARANAPFLAFLNPDAFPAPDWLSQLLAAAARHPQAAAFGSTQICDADEALYDGLGDVMHASGLCYRSGHRRPRAAPPLEGETFSACAAAMLVRTEAFIAVGGFDGRFFCYCEDVDLGFRLRLMGWPTIQARKAIVRHVGGGSAGVRTPFAERLGARNRLWTFVKNMPGPLFWPLLPVHLLASALVVTLNAAQGRGVHGWLGLVEAIRGLGPILAARRKIQEARRASSADIAAALSWGMASLARRAPVIHKPRARLAAAR